MVGSSKILTVSYGTFSCTLEGFDDPFSTMRSIAEYFRDLAADDRYFGAEPPTPDAEMLHRIAEREIQRRVEAHVEGGDVVLRQVDSGLSEDESDVTASEALADTAIVDMADLQSDMDDEEVFDASDLADESETEPSEELVEEDTAAEAASDDEPAEPEAPAGSIEEKLNRIRAVVERTRSRDLGAAAYVGSEISEQLDADDEASAADLTPGFAAEVDTSLISSVLAQNEEEPETESIGDAFADFEPANDEPQDIKTPEQDVEMTDSDAMIAATIEGAFVDTVEDESAVDLPDADAESAADAAFEAFADVEDATEETDVAEAEEADVAEVEEADVAEVETSTDLEDAITAFADTTEFEDEDGTGDDVNNTEDAIARLMAMTAGNASDENDPLPEAEVSDDFEETGPEVMIDFEEEAPEAVSEDDAADADDEITDPAPEAESDAAPQDDDEEEDDLWDRDFDAEAAATEEDAVEETAEPVDLSVELHEPEFEPEVATEPEEVRQERATSKSVHLKAPEEESDRLETETETAFKEGESTRRRSAIAHLKAAVAATRADKILSRVVGRDFAGDPEEQKDYREDLSKVVKSSSQAIEPADVTDLPVEDQPELEPEIADEEASLAIELEVEDEAAEDDRPSPLMLVSELRIEDEPEVADHSPRRVVSRELSRDASDDEGSDFPEFAKRVGANDLTDLLEAAAAHMAYVEDQPHFSRPQIMRRVAAVDPTVEESREAGLRSFGQLLRQGRIVKLQRGQFTVSDSTRFKPEHRIAGE